MKLSIKQLQQIDLIFKRAELFIYKPTRTGVFDIGYIKIKGKMLLGYHLECYPKNGNILKHSDLQFWIGEVTDFKSTTIDDFLEDFHYNESNGIEIEKIKITQIPLFKKKIYEMIKKTLPTNQPYFK